MDIDFPKRAGTNFPYMRPSEGGLFDVARRYFHPSDGRQS